jgi:hypothetical protein
VNIVRFVIALVLFVGGIFVLSSAFQFVGYEPFVFFAGIIVSTIGLYLSVGAFKRAES